jgi:regulator of sirC expression with transglutaminase-like and TPR domain
MVNMVLETRKGNPITLCLMYMVLGQRLGMPIEGVNLPNMFILTYKNEYIQFYINVFNKGIVFSRVDIDSYISQLGMSPSPEYYDPCTNTVIIARMLRNLIVSFERQGDLDRVDEIKQLLVLLGEGSN